MSEAWFNLENSNHPRCFARMPVMQYSRPEFNLSSKPYMYA